MKPETRKSGTDPVAYLGREDRGEPPRAAHLGAAFFDGVIACYIYPS